MGRDYIRYNLHGGLTLMAAYFRLMEVVLAAHCLPLIVFDNRRDETANTGKFKRTNQIEQLLHRRGWSE